ncbi:hypothetical protein [Alteromonas gilva]|uniref:Lipoprotein n=1 Tax=Alteromonas gilva TaxID=2987522 RepID=A0ABT5L6Z7_9ALTE|nr:hypothetical protein [Alteromonas gilva]MDC8832827.1 hypothetical protein [Alteromonas gilva]
MKHLMFILILVLCGCSSRTIPIKSDVEYSDIIEASEELEADGLSYYQCVEPAIGELMQDYLAIWYDAIENGDTVKSNIDYTPNTFTYLGNKSYYVYQFYMDADRQLKIDDLSLDPYSRLERHPKNAYCTSCNDSGFPDFILSAHEYVADELNDLLDDGTCAAYLEQKRWER